MIEPRKNFSTIEEVMIINGSLHTDNLQVNHMNVQGLFDDKNITYIFDDTLFIHSSKTVTGHKYFTNLTADELFVSEGIDMDALPDLIAKSKVIFHIDEDAELLNGIEVNSITFLDNLNGMDVETFNKNWLENGTHIIDGDYVFNNLSIDGNVTVNSNRINNVSLDTVFYETVKTNENFTFDDVSFGKLTKLTSVMFTVICFVDFVDI